MESTKMSNEEWLQLIGNKLTVITEQINLQRTKTMNANLDLEVRKDEFNSVKNDIIIEEKTMDKAIVGVNEEQREARRSKLPKYIEAYNNLQKAKKEVAICINDLENLLSNLNLWNSQLAIAIKEK